MSGPLTFVVTWIRRLLGFLPDTMAEFLWLPVFFVLLVVAVRLLFRHGLPFLTEWVRRLVAAVLALLMTPIMALLVVVAAPFRWIKANPPGALLAADDAIVATTTVTIGGVQRTAKVVAKASRANVFLLIALCVVVVWRWNATQCAQPSTGACVTPVVAWAHHVGIARGEPSTPSDDVSPSPQVSPPSGG